MISQGTTSNEGHLYWKLIFLNDDCHLYPPVLVLVQYFVLSVCAVRVGGWLAGGWCIVSPALEEIFLGLGQFLSSLGKAA